jgi:hypothetical protein
MTGAQPSVENKSWRGGVTFRRSNSSSWRALGRGQTQVPTSRRARQTGRGASRRDAEGLMRKCPRRQVYLVAAVGTMPSRVERLLGRVSSSIGRDSVTAEGNAWTHGGVRGGVAGGVGRERQR